MKYQLTLSACAALTVPFFATPVLANSETTFAAPAGVMPVQAIPTTADPILSATLSDAIAAHTAAPVEGDQMSLSASVVSGGTDAQEAALIVPSAMQDLAVDAPISAQTFNLASDAPDAQTMAASTVAAIAQYSGASAGAAEKREDSYTILLNQDSFFGFYPSFNGLIPIGDNIDFSFYGIFWTTDGFGTALGSDLWTEFGAGVAIHTMDGNLIVKPQIGITNGALLSGGVRDDTTGLPTGTGGNFLDGVVPSLTMNYSDDAFEAEFYGGYYAAVRNRNDPGAADFLHTWINAGAKIGPKFSAGAHYELLSLTRNKGGASAVVYQWVGPYVQFSTDNGFFARFTAGADVEDGNDGDFYKLTAGFSF